MKTIELNQKFKDIEYIRPDYSKVKSEIKKCIKKLNNASNYEEMKSAFLEKEDIMSEVSSMAEIAGIRATLDTNDKFYEEEDYINQTEISKVSLEIKKFNEGLLASPFKEDFINEFGDLIIKQIENSQKLINKEVIPNFSKEKKLCQEYEKTVAQCKINFRGEECNFYGLLKHMESVDRNERREAFLEWVKAYESISGKLDEIYDKLVALRCDSAKKLGFDSFIDNAYLGMDRFDYTKEDVKVFRDAIKEYLVPVANRLMMAQKERLGVDELYWYDEALFYPDGNPIPVGTKDELVNKANKMYHELSKETGEFFDFMVKNDLFDLETRPGKASGGYCTFIDKYKAPFIFANFNGTRADVETLTHEAGHAFQAYMASRNIKLSSQTWAGYETSEIHSMSMEHLTYPWMKLFFNHKQNRFIYAHLVNSLTCVPYLVAVDEFQHKVFENPTMNANERRATWKKIEKDYMPWRKYEDNEFLNEGGFWMQKAHIFLNPFYYIDYALAQTCAYQFLIKDLEDEVKCFEDYLALCKAGGSKGYKELLELANLKNPLEKYTVKHIVEQVENLIKDFSEHTLS